MKIACCKDCDERYSGCHDRCQEYQKQKDEGLKVNKGNRRWSVENYTTTRAKR